MVEIGDFAFEPTTGEVTPVDPAAGAGASRLPPQPARLLELLIAADGRLVTREEIRELLWPDVHVDFDQSLSFCVRQIREAFGDSATNPTYVETLPRRGYRLIRPATTPREASPPEGASDRKRAPWGLRALALVAVALLVAAAAYLQQDRGDSGSKGPIRLALMPFELAGDEEAQAELALISESLLSELAAGGGGRLEIVGPRTTAGYSAFPFPELDRLSADLQIDFVLNARYMELRGETRFLVELIRLDDGAHPWVEAFTDVREWQEIVGTVCDGVLGLPRATAGGRLRPRGRSAGRRRDWAARHGQAATSAAQENLDPSSGRPRTPGPQSAVP